MRVLGYLTAYCLFSWGLIWLIVVPEVAVATFLGMIIPLLLSIGTIVLAAKIQDKRPEKLFSFMTKAFIAKMIVYGLYTVLIVGVLSFEAVPFAISFTFYFVTLHLAATLHLRNMLRIR